MLLSPALALLALPVPLFAGYGFADVTPPEPLPLGGYTERRDKVMDGVGDRLSARVLCLRQGDATVALVSFEALTVPGSLYREVVRKAVQNGFRGEILLAATHTHCAPDSQMLNDRMRTKIPGIATFKSKWLDWYSTKIADIIVKSRPLFPVGPVMARTAHAPYSRFRRQQHFGLQPPSTAVRITFPFGGAELDVLHYPAHPTLFDAERNTTTGDWPGEWMGWATTRMFFNGAIGDVSPLPPEGDTAEQRVRNFASALNRLEWKPAFTMSTERLQPVAMSVVKTDVRLPEVVPHPQFAKRNGIPDVLATSLVRNFAAEQAHVMVVRMARIALIGIPGEPTVAVGAQIERIASQAGVALPVVVSFANEWLGYILTKEEYADGGYEATLSFHGPELADRVIEAVEKSFSASSS